MRFAFAFLALAALTSTSAQDVRAPYFSLASNRTWQPGDKPSVQLWAQNVPALEFRVYKVRDPIQFFRQLENIHEFGANTPRPRAGKNKTIVEKFHALKRSLRASLRDSLRAQFTPASRAGIRGFAEGGKPPATAPQAVQYPNLPVLNPQQLVATFKQSLPAKKERWESETVPIEVKEKGVYLIEAAHEELRAYTVVVVSDIAILAKVAPGRVVGYLVEAKSGAPVSGTDVRLWANREQSGLLKSAADGSVDFTFKGEDPGEPSLLARRGDDFAISSLSQWNLNDNPDQRTMGYAYTDRPIYRPGHTVHWKAILRTQTGSGYALPEHKSVDVEVHDSEGRPIDRRQAFLNGLGTVSGEFPIPASASLGYYWIEMSAGGAHVSTGFQVEEYKKPEYEVRVNVDPRRVLQGQAAKASIEARYFFGEPVKGAKVTYVVHRARYWSPMFYMDEADDVTPDEGGEYYGGEQASQGEGTLGDDGKLIVSIPTDGDDQRRFDMRYRVEARVTDEGNREISGAGSFLATRGNFVLNIQPARYVAEPNTQAAFTVEARNYENQPVAIPFRVELRYWQPKQATRLLATVEGRTDATGSATVRLPVGDGGSYRARVIAASDGREVEDEGWLWVTGSWRSSEAGERLTIVPDKKSYKPGDTANILIVTGGSDAPVVVTVEGNRLYSHQVVRSKDGMASVSIPVKADYQPNVYIGASFISGGELHEGSKRLKVPADDKRLNVEVTPSKREFKPGEPAVYTILAKDSTGKPAQAEFSLGVVDEAIYAIRPDTTQDIFGFFYGQAPNRVSTESSLSYYFRGEAGKRRMQLAELRSRRNLANLKPEALIQPKVRKAFPDTIHWVASVMTDANGRATARFNFPDSLTTWRATARGISSDTHVGAAIDKVIVRKNLMLRLVVPRFFTQGDEVTISVLVHNYLKSRKSARVSLEAAGLDLLDGGARDVPVEPGGDAKVDYRVRVKNVREAVVTGKALTDEESDAMELTLPINPFGVKLTQAKAGSIAADSGDQTVEIEFPAGVEATSRALEVQASPSMAGAIFGALEYLTSFPYGCTEQTMSSFLPNVIVSKALTDLNVPARVDSGELRKKIDAGTDRLYSFQHEDGGWGWWTNDESHPFMSAYVVAGLAQARTAGMSVRGDVTERGSKWLRARLDSEAKLAPDQRAYMVYALALAGSKEKAAFDNAWAVRNNMTAYGHALLGLALHHAGDERAFEMATALEASAKSDARDAFWPVDDDHLLGFHADTTAEATAFALKLLARTRPSSPLLEKAAFWLVSHRDQGSYWSSTKKTAMVVFGLTDYLKQSGELKPDFRVTVSINGKPAIEKRFTAADALSPDAPKIRLTANELQPGINRIQIRKSGAGRLYWSAAGDYYSSDPAAGATGSAALNVTREYFKLIPVKEGNRITHSLEPLDGPLAPGDTVAVRLTVTGGDWSYLLIEDPIPAGAEFVQRDDLYQIRNRPPWWRWSYSRREFRDDRAALFQQYFNRNTAQHIYLMKIVNPGNFRVSPARVQPMYQPSYSATSDAKTIEVRP